MTVLPTYMSSSTELNHPTLEQEQGVIKMVPYLIFFLCLAIIDFCIGVARPYFDYVTVVNFEVVCGTTNPHQLEQDFKMIDTSIKHKSSGTAAYLLQPSSEHLYFSFQTSYARILFRNWEAYYESLAVQATQDFFQMYLKSNYTLQDKGNQSNMQYIVVKSLFAVHEGIGNLPNTNIKTLEGVISSLRFIKSINFWNLLAEDLFWTHPLNNISDILVPLNFIAQPRLQVYPTQKSLPQSQF